MDEQPVGEPVPEPRDRPRAGSEMANAVLWFRSVVAHAPDLLAVLDPSGVVTYISPSVEPLLGYSPAELVGQRFAPLSDVDAVALNRTLGEQPGVPIFMEGGLRHRDGRLRAFEGNVTNLLADPVVQGFVVNARDVTDRREAETARRRSEMALRAIVQASPVAILALDRRGQVHVWNVACEQMFGWTAADIVGGRAPFATEELDVSGLVEGAFAGDTVTGYEASITRRDGDVVECNLAIAPLRDSNGRPVTAVVIVADVTEQKRAQRAVEASEARFRSLVQHLTDMILVLEPDGTIAYASPSASTYIGIEAEDMIGRKPTTDWVLPEDFGALGEMFLRLRAHPGAVETMTARFRRGDGEYRWVEMIAVNQLDDPAVRGIVTNSRDITERVDADAAIRASEERLQALVASASDVISLIDAEGKLRYSSAVTTHVLGYPEGAGYGEYIVDLVHPDDQPIIQDLFERVRDVRGMLRPFEVRLQRADG